MAENTEYTIESTASKLFNWSELWRYKELFYFFTWRDVKVKYKQTLLGFLWAVLQPLLMMLIFTLFLGKALDDGHQPLPYPIFVFSGLLIWNVFATGMTGAANSMVNNSGIIKKIYFPRLIIPASAVLVAAFDFFMTLFIFIPMLFIYHQPVFDTAWWCWPVALIMSLAATIGPGCWLAALNVKYRDFRYVIPFVVQVLFFVSPVIYPISMVKYHGLQYVVALSPMYVAIELFRYPLTGVWPNGVNMLISSCSTFVILLIGLTYFRRTEDFFADFA